MATIGRAYVTSSTPIQYGFWKAKIFAAAYGSLGAIAVIKIQNRILQKKTGVIEFTTTFPHQHES